MSNTWKLIICFLLVFLVGAGGSVATSDSIPNWYADLTKPPFNPPNWIFGPVWTLLYALMAVSLFLVWKKKQTNKTIYARKIFFIQLGLNLLWSLVFFGAHQIALALLIIAALWGFILYSIILFRKINKTAAYILIPYLLWVSFATVLNASLLLLN